MRKNLPAKEVNQKSLAKVVESAFYAVVHLYEGDVVTESPELKITLRFIPDNRLQLFTLFPVEVGAEMNSVLGAINLFNARMRGLKAFIPAEEGEPLVVVDTDFDYSDGLSTKSLVLRMRRFESNVFQGFEFKRLLKYFNTFDTDVGTSAVSVAN